MKKILTLFFLLFTLIPLYSQIENDEVGNDAIQITSFNFCNLEEACNLEIYNGSIDWVSNSSPSGVFPISRVKEYDLGAITVANINDTDGDGIIDNIDNNGVIDDDLGRNEVDLMKLVIKKPIPDNGGSATLSIVSGNIKLWNNPDKTGEINVPPSGISFSTSQLDKVIFIEAIEQSSSVGDIELKLEYMGNEDMVRATGIWFIEHEYWVTRVDAMDLTVVDPVAIDPVNNPNPITDLLDLGTGSSQLETTIINGNISWKGSRYGHGTYREESGNNPQEDEKIGGKFLFEFEIFPHLTATEISDFKIKLDITRQRKTRLRSIVSGSGDLIIPNNNERDFPWEISSDNETPNDDGGSFDEDNTLKNDFIYSYDAAGINRDDSYVNFAAFNMSKTSFSEFVRIKFGEDFQNQNGLVEGTRASNRSDWHSFYYAKRGENGLMIEDNDIVSLSNPIENTSQIDKGNFELSIISSGATSVGTSGYKAEFDGEDKWILTNNTSGETFESNEVSPSQGAVWTINTGGIQVKITQTGGINFMEGENITFSSFRTSAMIGKVNDTDYNFGVVIVDAIF